MYLLDSQQVMDLLSRDQNRQIFQWLAEANPKKSDLFVSIISLGQIADTIERMAARERNHWRRLLQEGRRQFQEAGSLVDVDAAVVDAWQSNLRGQHLADIENADEELGEDDRLIVATAIARNYTLVTAGSPVFSQIVERTSLTIVEL
ncbi:PIN domain-containing protein [Komagataeibacter saccharivorans]|uniref:PIN domain-containing protein n=1 Tax=Komagataeibacter saccharivorans TaxID=265959 RepID=UPI000C82D033|nr:PIN domain-containing protein [Komagataeibacter saccharivorans]